jgi:hypothetical protein
MKTKKAAVVPVVPEAPKFNYTVVVWKTETTNFSAEVEVEATSDTEAVAIAQFRLDTEDPTDRPSIAWIENDPDDSAPEIISVTRRFVE